jgi:type II secretory ATPase GspE/PulE/Tfp pilus assembly ATPase PilB-like protein
LVSQDVQIQSLEDIGFTRDQQARLERVLNLPYGLLVVAGPKDSGRTTLASALVDMAARSERQVVTVSRHGGVGISGALCFTPDRLQEALSQDPDVVLMDDVSLDSVYEAAQSALEGRLVVLTVSGSRAIHTIRALAKLGSSWRLAATLQAVVAVRLLRRVCNECSTGVDLNPAVRRELGLPSNPSANESFRQGKGCSACWGTGYKGRVLTGEMVFSSAALRDGILDDADEDELMNIARENGFHTLRELGVLAAAQGKTTVDELRIALSH